MIVHVPEEKDVAPPSVSLMIALVAFATAVIPGGVQEETFWFEPAKPTIQELPFRIFGVRELNVTVVDVWALFDAVDPTASVLQFVTEFADVLDRDSPTISEAFVHVPEPVSEDDRDTLQPILAAPVVPPEGVATVAILVHPEGRDGAVVLPER